jgi:hypothetical protein
MRLVVMVMRHGRKVRLLRDPNKGGDRFIPPVHLQGRGVSAGRHAGGMPRAGTGCAAAVGRSLVEGLLADSEEPLHRASRGPLPRKTGED